MQRLGMVMLVLGLLIGISGAVLPSDKTRRVFSLGAFVALSIAMGLMVAALLKVDTSFAYVVQYTQQSAPVWLRIGALWSGASGSLLLWAWLASLLAAWRCFWGRPIDGISIRILLALASLLSLACLAMGLYDVMAIPPVDGTGLPVALQDPWLIAHPPLVFAAYCGLTWLYGLSLADKLTTADLLYAKRIGLLSWLLLSTAIWMGMCWAQRAQGWGVAWSWDAIETASLATWLTLSASLVWLTGAIQGKLPLRLARISMGLVWPVALLCTFAARGGQLISAHGYGDSGIGWVLLVIAVLLALLPPYVNRINRAVENQSSLGLYVGILLLGMAAATALGTLLPMLSLGAASGRIAPPTYYATVLIPMSAILLCLTLIAVVKTARAHQRIVHLADFIFVLTASVAVSLAVLGRLTLVGVLMGICWLVYVVRFRFDKMGDESF